MPGVGLGSDHLARFTRRPNKELGVIKIWCDCYEGAEVKLSSKALYSFGRQIRILRWKMIDTYLM
jgi:hypothetical protein